MSFLGLKKKKSEPLRKLSERDIQKKLYGDLSESGEGSVGDFSTAPLEAEKAKQKSVPPKPTEEQFKTQAESYNFEHPAARSMPSSGPDKSFMELESKPKAFRQVTVKKAAYQTEKKPSWIRPHLRDALTASKKISQSATRAAGDGLVTLLSWFFQGLHQSLRFLYARRYFLKQIAVWALGIAVIFVLFSSVHYLNVKREKAIVGNGGAVEQKAETAVPASAAEKSEAAPNEAVTAESAPAIKETPLSPVETPAPAPLSEGRYAIQVATYATEADAQRISGQLNASGWPSFVRGVPRSGGRIYYSVYLGRYRSYNESQEQLASFRNTDIAKPFPDAFIRSLQD